MAKKDEQKEDVRLSIDILKKDYPELVDAIQDETIKRLNSLDFNTFCATFPEQIGKLSTYTPGSNIGKSGAGFMLEIDDPYAAGTLRTYQHLSGNKALRLPYILPYDDKSTRKTLENYIVRASGGCDIERAKAANKALEKCK